MSSHPRHTMNSLKRRRTMRWDSSSSSSGASATNNFCREEEDNGDDDNVMIVHPDHHHHSRRKDSCNRLQDASPSSYPATSQTTTRIRTISSVTRNNTMTKDKNTKKTKQPKQHRHDHDDDESSTSNTTSSSKHSSTDQVIVLLEQDTNKDNRRCTTGEPKRRAGGGRRVSQSRERRTTNDNKNQLVMASSLSSSRKPNKNNKATATTKKSVLHRGGGGRVPPKSNMASWKRDLSDDSSCISSNSSSSSVMIIRNKNDKNVSHCSTTTRQGGSVVKSSSSSLHHHDQSNHHCHRNSNIMASPCSSTTSVNTIELTRQIKGVYEEQQVDNNNHHQPKKQQQHRPLSSQQVVDSVTNDSPWKSCNNHDDDHGVNSSNNIVRERRQSITFQRANRNGHSTVAISKNDSRPLHSSSRSSKACNTHVQTSRFDIEDHDDYNANDDDGSVTSIDTNELSRRIMASGRPTSHLLPIPIVATANTTTTTPFSRYNHNSNKYLHHQSHKNADTIMDQQVHENHAQFEAVVPTRRTGSVESMNDTAVLPLMTIGNNNNGNNDVDTERSLSSVDRMELPRWIQLPNPATVVPPPQQQQQQAVSSRPFTRTTSTTIDQTPLETAQPDHHSTRDDDDNNDNQSLSSVDTVELSRQILAPFPPPQPNNGASSTVGLPISTNDLISVLQEESKLDDNDDDIHGLSNQQQQQHSNLQASAHVGVEMADDDFVLPDQDDSSSDDSTNVNHGSSSREATSDDGMNRSFPLPPTGIEQSNNTASTNTTSTTTTGTVTSNVINPYLSWNRPKLSSSYPPVPVNTNSHEQVASREHPQSLPASWSRATLPAQLPPQALSNVELCQAAFFDDQTPILSDPISVPPSPQPYLVQQTNILLETIHTAEQETLEVPYDESTFTFPRDYPTLATPPFDDFNGFVQQEEPIHSTEQGTVEVLHESSFNIPRDYTTSPPPVPLDDLSGYVRQGLHSTHKSPTLGYGSRTKNRSAVNGPLAMDGSETIEGFSDDDHGDYEGNLPEFGRRASLILERQRHFVHVATASECYTLSSSADPIMHAQLPFGSVVRENNTHQLPVPNRHSLPVPFSHSMVGDSGSYTPAVAHQEGPVRESTHRPLFNGMSSQVPTGNRIIRDPSFNPAFARGVVQQRPWKESINASHPGVIRRFPLAKSNSVVASNGPDAPMTYTDSASTTHSLSHHSQAGLASTGNTHTSISTARNDLVGGSGVGLGSYQLTIPSTTWRSSRSVQAREDQSPEDDEPPPSHRVQERRRQPAKTSRKKNKSPKKGGHWKGKKGGRGRVDRYQNKNNRHYNNNGAQRCSGRRPFSSSSSETRHGRGDDPNLGHVGGAEITF